MSDNVNTMRRLNVLLTKHMDRRETPEVIYSTLIPLAEAARAVDKESAASIERSAATLRPLFGWFGAQKAWDQHRKSLPFLKRLTSPRRVPDEFERAYIRIELDRGDALVREALEVQS